LKTACDPQAEHAGEAGRAKEAEPEKIPQKQKRAGNWLK